MVNQSNLEKEFKELELLKEGKDVECWRCHKGHYKPLNNTDCSKAHYFVCDKCGSIVCFEPVIDFDWRH